MLITDNSPTTTDKYYLQTTDDKYVVVVLSSTAHTRRISTVVKTSVSKQTNVDTSQSLTSMLKHNEQLKMAVNAGQK